MCLSLVKYVLDSSSTTLQHRCVLNTGEEARPT